MTKAQQIIENEACEAAQLLVGKNVSYSDLQNWKSRRLGHCKAVVFTGIFRDTTTGNHYNLHILQSYETIVAFALYDFNTETISFYDVLRLNYEYTNSSAMHIRKFKKEYAITGNNHYYTWKEV